MAFKKVPESQDPPTLTALDNCREFLEDSLATGEVMYPRSTVVTAIRILNGTVEYVPPLTMTIRQNKNP